MPGRLATEVPVLKSLVRLELGKQSSSPVRLALEADALPFGLESGANRQGGLMCKDSQSGVAAFS